MNKPSIFLLPRVPWDATHTIRLCIPGIHKDHAVFLEAQIDGSVDDIEQLTKRIADAIGGNLRYEQS